MRRHVSIIAAVGLAATVVAAAPVGAADGGSGLSLEMRGDVSTQPRVGPAEQLVSATATFSARATGMPNAASRPDQTLLPGAVLEVTYGYHWETGVLEYTFEARPTTAGLRPDDAPIDYVGVGMGLFEGASCNIDTGDESDVNRYLPERLVYGSGDATTAPNAGQWNCAALYVRSADGATTYDAYVSPLAVTTATPELSLSAPKKDRLVTGVWTRIPVTVANAAAEGIAARDVVVSGKGKGVKVRLAKLGEIEGQDDTDGHVWAKLTKPKATLRLAVTEQGEALGTASVKLRQRPAPVPPRAGRWVANGVSFTVRGTKVRAFSIATQTTCGGYPDIPTTTNNNYSFQTTAIPRNNEVVGTERGNQGSDAAYSAYLELEFVSSTKARGRFSYYGPARCTAFGNFTAKRKG